MASDKYLEVLGRLEQLEDLLNSLKQGRNPVTSLVLKDPKSGARARITYDAVADDIRVDRIK